MNLGYACINLTLANKNPKIITTRSMVKKTFFNKGLEYVSLLSLLNSQDLFKILKWNYTHKIKLFRLSSDFFPWSSEYKLHHLHSFNDMIIFIIKNCTINYISPSIYLNLFFSSILESTSIPLIFLSTNHL